MSEEAVAYPMDHPLDAAMHCVAVVTNAPRLALVAAALLWLLVRAPLSFPAATQHQAIRQPPLAAHRVAFAVCCYGSRRNAVGVNMKA
jgi:hypothetical protein